MPVAPDPPNPFRPNVYRSEKEATSGGFRAHSHVPSRYATPTARRELLVQEAAQKLKERKRIDDARYVAIEALRVLKDHHGVGSRSASPMIRQCADRRALLEQVREEENRIVGASSPSRSASRSLSPADANNRRARSPFPNVHSKVATTFQTNAKPFLRNHTPPFRVRKEDVDVPLTAAFDGKFDHNRMHANSKFAPFFSAYAPGVKATLALPERYVVPDERNRKLLISQAKEDEKARNERIAVEHPPPPKWDYWEARHRKVSPPSRPTNETMK